MRKEALAIAKISIYHETHETSKNKRSWNYYSDSTFLLGTSPDGVAFDKKIKK